MPSGVCVPMVPGSYFYQYVLRELGNEGLCRTSVYFELL